MFTMLKTEQLVRHHTLDELVSKAEEENNCLALAVLDLLENQLEEIREELRDKKSEGSYDDGYDNAVEDAICVINDFDLDEDVQETLIERIPRF